MGEPSQITSSLPDILRTGSLNEDRDYQPQTCSALSTLSRVLLNMQSFLDYFLMAFPKIMSNLENESILFLFG